MADQLDDDRDEEWFKEVYGTEYTGPPKAPRGGDTRREVAPAAKASNKRLSTNVSDSEDEDEPRDPNAVPTDFTSREAKVWEAKAKAVERNWKRRKEEELTCHLCGEVGHFSQGCPTTLGGNRKSGEVVERIPLRDKRLKPRIIGTGGAIIQGIEKDTNCRLKLEDNLTAGPGAFFVKITGPDRMTVIKAVNAVRKLVDQVEEEWKQQPVGWKAQGAERGSRGGAPAVNPLITAQMQHIAVQRLQHVNPGSGRTESAPPVDEEKRTIEHIASQLEARRQWEAVSGSSQHSLNGSYTEGRTASGAGSMSASLAVKGPGPIDGGSTFYPDNAGLYPNQAEQGMELELEYDEHSLDELERRFLEETIELTKDQNKEEDKENARHRKILREIQEQYQQKMTQLRAKQAKQREDFLRHEAHMRYQQPPSTGYGHYPYARSVPPYDDSLPPYDMTYEQQIPTDTTHGHPLVYESYSDAGGQSYNRKQGYDGSKVHSKNQVYETSSHPYGGSPPYPAYG